MSELAPPEPFWPMLGAHESPTSVTVTCIPPACKSASELLPTSELESRPSPRIGSRSKVGSPATCRADVSAASGAVMRIFSGCAMSYARLEMTERRMSQKKETCHRTVPRRGGGVPWGG